MLQDLATLHDLKKELVSSEESCVGHTGAEIEEELLLQMARERSMTKKMETESMPGSARAKVTLQEYEDMLAQFDLESSSDESGLEEEFHVDAPAPAPKASAASAASARLASAQLKAGLRCIVRWCEQSAAALTALKAVHDCKGLDLDDASGEVSIVSSRPHSQTEISETEQDFNPVEVHVVKWDDAGSLLGRSVRIDSRNRIVWSPPILFGKPVPAHVFSRDLYDILVPRVGARCVRQKDALRDTIPSPMVRFLAIVKAAAFAFNQEWASGPRRISVCESLC